MIRYLWIAVSGACALANEPLVVESVAITGADVHVNLETQVGRPYYAAAVQRDVRYLWALGRFDDVRAEVTQQGGAAAVHFTVAPKPRLKLHEIRMQPHSFGMQPKLPEGSDIDDFQAHQLAMEIKKQLKQAALLHYYFGASGASSLVTRPRVITASSVSSANGHTSFGLGRPEPAWSGKERSGGTEPST